MGLLLPGLRPAGKAGQLVKPLMSEDVDQIDYTTLRRNVGALGELLGETMAAAEGEDFLALIEQIRTLSRSAREGDGSARDHLLEILRNLDNEQLVPVARAFAQFLNLAKDCLVEHPASAPQFPNVTKPQKQKWKG